MRKIFNMLFQDESKDDKEFREVSEKLKDFKHKLQYELEVLDDKECNEHPNKFNTPMDDIMFVKNEWVELPEAFGNGVLSMGMEETEKRKAFLVHYEPDSELFTHSHPENLERIQVLTGYIMDNTNGAQINEGQTYMVDKNVKHNIVTKDVEAYLFIVFSEEIDTLTVNYLIK